MSISSPAPITLLITHKGSYSKRDRLLSVKAEVRLIMMPTLSCCFPHCCAPIKTFIYFKRATSAVWCPNIVFLFVCYYPAAAVSKQQSVAKCSFVCALRGLMGYYAEWPDSPCTISGGLERHKHNVVRPTPLSLSSHCQHITSPGPVGNVTSDVWMYLTTLPLLSLQRA